MIVNTLAKTLSTPKEQDIEMPPIHENSRKRGWEDAKPDLPSMKKPEIMDDKLKMKLSSMKTAKNVDGKFKNQLPSMKTAKNVDGKMQARSVCLADYIKSLVLCVNWHIISPQ